MNEDDFEREVRSVMQPLVSAVEQEAQRLQRQNKQMRWIYVSGMVVTLVLGLLLQRVLPIVVGVFFAALLLYNEHLIRKMRKAGFR